MDTRQSQPPAAGRRRPASPRGLSRPVSRADVLVGGGLLAAGLIGAGGLVGAWFGVGGGGAPAAGPVSASGPGAPGPSVVAGTFGSALLAANVDYVLISPPGVPADEPLPVCLCLHDRGETARWFAGPLGAPAALAAVVAAGTPAFALAAVDGGDLWWHERPVGRDPLRMATAEFLGFAAGQYGLGAAGRPVAVAGWSMGGFGALLAAEREPGRFRAAVLSSPAVFGSYARARAVAPDAFDGAPDFRRNDVLSGARGLTTPVRLDVGRDDPLLGDARALAAALRPGSAVVTAPGGRDLAYWRRALYDQLTFVGARLAAP